MDTPTPFLCRFSHHLTAEHDCKGCQALYEKCLRSKKGIYLMAKLHLTAQINLSPASRDPVQHPQLESAGAAPLTCSRGAHQQIGQRRSSCTRFRRPCATLTTPAGTPFIAQHAPLYAPRLSHSLPRPQPRAAKCHQLASSSLPIEKP